MTNQKRTLQYLAIGTASLALALLVPELADASNNQAANIGNQGLVASMKKVETFTSENVFKMGALIAGVWVAIANIIQGNLKGLALSMLALVLGGFVVNGLNSQGLQFFNFLGN